MSVKIRGLKKKVGYILEVMPDTRNSDVALTIAIWKTYYPKYIKKGSTGEEGVWLKDIFELPREDNIKRIRAHYQNELGKFLPTSWEVAKQRKIEEARWKAYMSSVHKFNPHET